jgi:two-component system response regulator RstA
MPPRLCDHADVKSVPPSEPRLLVLLVEDDERLAALTREYLEKHGAAVTVARDGERGLAEALRGRHDVVLLDVMLPGRDGLSVCQKIRERSDVPIIMITARGEEADRVLGLEIGADDYVPKPYSARELLARIRAVVRRARGGAGPRSRRVVVGRLVLDPGAREARLGDRPLDLTGYEFALLYALAERAGRVLGRDRLMELARGSAEEAFDRSIDVHVSRLRVKLGDDPKRPRLIRTVRGVGYQYAAEEEA